jgi:hypothetical protein
MKLYSIKIMWVFCLLLAVKINGQIPNNSWRDHLPYTNAFQLAEVENSIFCATDGGLFSFNKGDNSLRKYSKVSGLSDVEISAINYSKDTKTLVVAYKNGNIDLVRDDSIINIPDIKRKLITGEKGINSIFFINDNAYLATGFGIVVIDINRKEIKDTYQFGELGTKIAVNDVAFDGNFLFAATDQGIYKANINSQNLVDYNYWSRISNVPFVDSSYLFVVYFGGKLLACYKNPSTKSKEIIEIMDNSWEKWEYSQNYCSWIYVHNNLLIVVEDYKVRVYNQQFERINQVGIAWARHALYDADNTIWIADFGKGLLKWESGQFEEIAPNGPAYKDVGCIAFESDRLWVGGGNEATQWKDKGAYSFINERWDSYNQKTLPELTGFRNINTIAVDPSDPDHVYGGSYGYGVVEFEKGEVKDIYDEQDGILRPVEGYGHGYIRIMGMD